MQRRKFMTMLGAVGITSLTRPNSGFSASVDYFPALCTAVRDQARLQNTTISDDELP